MNEKQKNEVKVGLTVLIGLTILVTGFFLVKEWSLAVNDYPLVIRFESSGGLQKGDAVTVNGVQSGQVESVLLDANSVLVRVMLHPDVQLKEDAVATIQILELMGGKKIEIRQGVGAELLDTDRIMTGHVDPDIAGALGMVGQLRDDIVQMSTNANSLLINLNDLIGDKEMRDAIKETFRDLHVTMRDLRGFLVENRQNTGQVMRNLVSLTTDLDSLLSVVRPRLTTALDRSTEVLGVADTLFTDVRSLLQDVRKEGGLFHRFIADTSFTTRIDTTVRKIDAILDLLQGKGIKVRIRL